MLLLAIVLALIDISIGLGVLSTWLAKGHP
jgi:hypothetical protein